ncbi:D-lactate dehydrogenase [Altererythrobacter sp. BO-6]|uniref:D-lactate dehydrogenase n=1 Tax=Altererythrobacter sp. BO-6 TaxID=2604537 RepID=UPI0013E1701C|nr:D-lactate dehydrogenase [Altererythrobacter sp. BO-6]QIG53439.1 D-lactate dehydrogenase [Altererythrobacter sp. BO-6]
MEPNLVEDLIRDLRAAVGRKYLLTDQERTDRYSKGYRVGGGPVLAVVRPGTLLELWRAAETCTSHGVIMIVQAANTGLTGGSTPYGDYDRPVVLISTTRITAVLLLMEGQEAICLAGSTLTGLERAIRPMGRMPHSVIGSSCIGASVVGGICNNSGGALVRRGPAFTRYSLFARIAADGGLRLHNELGRDLGKTPEEILGALDRGDTGIEEEFTAFNSMGRSIQPLDYADHLRQAAPTPARFNADAGRLHAASGCAGKLVVFAVRVPTFPAPKRERSFIVGANSVGHFSRLRRAMLDHLDPLPTVCEYMHRSASQLAASHGRDICQTLALFGPAAMPRMLNLQKRVDGIGRRVGLGNHLAGRVSQKLSHLGGHPLPVLVQKFMQAYEHVLLVTAEDGGIAPLEELLRTSFASTGANFLPMSKAEADAAFRLRFASAGATVRMRDLSDGCCELAALDIALPRDTVDWLVELPDELERQVQDRAIYGHFMCHVFHLDYVLKPGFRASAFEKGVKALVEARGGQMPAEHNFGHLYEAPEHVVRFYRELDPTNSLNPGIGRTSRSLNWAG